MNDHDNRLRNIETKLRTTRRICLDRYGTVLNSSV